MFRCLKNHKPCLPEWWLRIVVHHPLHLLILILCGTLILLYFTVQHFKITTDLTEMVASDLPFRQNIKKFQADFPELSANIVVVVEGATPEQTRQARDRLAARLHEESDFFRSVYIPGDGPFFTRNGLLYLSLEELEAQLDRLVEVQPFLGRLAQDFSLHGLFAVIEDLVAQEEVTIAESPQLQQLFTGLAEVFSEAAHGPAQPISWQKLMLDQPFQQQEINQLILLQPIPDRQAASPAKPAILKIRALVAELKLDEIHGASVRLTGKPVINHEDLRSVRLDIGTASLISLILVGITLYIGLGTLRLVVVNLLTLLVGLAWTLGFAILSVGRLNLISVTFVVLFIGLGIDYSIQVTLRYQELREAGQLHRGAVTEAIRVTGNPLILCSITTAIGFYAFVPTAYVGASELGIISGTGMLIILLANLTVLPALMSLLPVGEFRPPPFPVGGKIATTLAGYHRPILIGATVAALASLAALSGIRFDANPLNLSNPQAEAIRTAQELFREGGSPLWTISATAADLQQAQHLAEQLRLLPEVEKVVTLESFIPKRQNEKLEQIADLALFMPAPPQPRKKENSELRPSLDALDSLARSLETRLGAEGSEPPEPAIRTLAAGIRRFREQLIDAGQKKLLLRRLEAALLPNLGSLLQRLGRLMEAERIDRANLPAKLVKRYRSDSGLYRVQVFPREDLTKLENLRNFVVRVKEVAPNATDQPVTILGAGETVGAAFRNATILAFFLISLFLRTVARSWKVVLLVLSPVLLALLYTTAVAQAFSLHFNFANIIVVPLLLGIGVDFSLHMVERLRERKGSTRHILRTSTARAVLFSALTTAMSFGSLAFIRHAGTASMGKLLTLCIALILICTLIILPAFLQHQERLKRRHRR